ncbi:zinc-dependent sulfurtransferase SufU [Deinococcus xinjiangensis]|uniref:Zinc-dependent sulfurtransferase SufU n=1 Tax=Deinococcus xinjiangensis TaxID=457454 RepID=A0ABP9VBP5_9DEIO
MSALKDLYKQVVLEHYRKPRNFGDLPDATHAEGGHNPSCGDQLELMLKMRGDTIEDAKFTAKGCAISVASASLMTGLIRGKTVPEALALAEQFSQMMQTGEAAPELGESAALQGVHTLHTRVKCATLGWQTLKVLLERAEKQV